jgi:hypothetical protein
MQRIVAANQISVHSGTRQYKAKHCSVFLQSISDDFYNDLYCLNKK